VDSERRAAGTDPPRRRKRVGCRSDPPGAETGCGVFLRRVTAEGKEGKVGEHFIGYVVPLVVLVGMAFGLPRWFEWRRSLVKRLQDQPDWRRSWIATDASRT
jgi:hypothetical protein